jgi:tellurite methyltransferase
MAEQDSTEGSPTPAQWASYAKATSEREPRQFLLKVAERFEKPGFAIDIGCGGGVESRALLRLGWSVLALDKEPKAIEAVTQGVPAGDLARLQTQLAGFDAMQLPQADLIWAGRSLPFAPPSEAAQSWIRILDAVKPGGRIACDLFGERHAWVSAEGMNSVTAESIEASLDEFEIEHLKEFEGERQTLFDGMLPWHSFTVVARKR